VKWLAAPVLAVLAGLPCSAVTEESGGTPDADPLAIGQRIYREGILPAGEALRGVGEAGVTLSGKDAACATCHRRSGYGSSEGPIEVRAITSPALFGERVAPAAPGSPPPVAPPVAASPGTTAGPPSAAEAARANAQVLRAARTAMFAGSRPRPAYDDASLARSIREGIDVTGRVMDAAMPRYALDAAALASLTAYLKTLSATASPGVTEAAVHFATVIQPGTDSAQRRAVVELLQVYFHDRNDGLRDEVRRQQAGGVNLGRIYREWVLHVWDLKGASDTWGAQLEAFNRQQPVFALVSGLGRTSWRPIHEFSERFGVPCIFPQVEVPVVDGPNFYTVYLSQGMTLEAQALAKYLRDAGERGSVLQVYRRDDASATAAAAFRKAWTAAESDLEDRELDASPGTGFWEQLAHEASGATLLLWLRPEDLAHAQALIAAESHVKAVYLSSGLIADQRTGMAPDAAGRLRFIYPQDLPAMREARLEVVKRWMHNNGIELTDEKVQLNAYLAATVLGMQVSHSKDIYSREFLLERMEHQLGTALELSIYPHLSLGPGQRFASKGSYVVRVDGEVDRQLSLLSDWIVP
jgi:ABC-type branched-subunit amino acid transport system substrate-binding protein